MSRALLPILSAGLAIRFLFLWLAGTPEPFADESNYLTLALSRLRFGFFPDSGHFLWPPGYPFVLFHALREGGADGVGAVRVLQIFASCVVGFHVMRFAEELSGIRAARVAGWLWVFAFPLIEFSHVLWPETLFLAVFITGLRLLIDARGRSLSFVTAGALFGLSLLLKESALYLYIALPFLLFLRHRETVSLPGALTVVLAATIVVMPWMLRNQEYYGEPGVIGATLGENMYRRVNANYRNLDYPVEHRLALYEANALVHDALVNDERPKWIRYREENVVLKDATNFRLGVAFILDDPVAFAKGRVKRVADFFSPHSFFVRHLAMARHERIQSLPVRRTLAGGAILLSLFTMASAALGFGRLSDRAPARTVFVTAILYFALLVGALGGLTRYRVPIEPIVIVLAAFAWGGPGGIRASWKCTPLAARVALGVLLALWALNAREWIALLGLMGGAK
ncbi:MAG: hypothetical protein HKN20_10915 [Gemmatimonadetes bacterium]|nr:hypothetical protein [Gemmatimonadota bacterium]